MQIVTQFSEQIVKIDSNCKKALKDFQVLNRIMNSKVQHLLLVRKYVELENIIEKHNIIENNSLVSTIGSIAENCITLVDQIIPLCETTLIGSFKYVKEMLTKMTCQYHSIGMEQLPIMKLYINLHRDIASALETGSPELDKMYAYTAFGDFNKELESVSSNYMMMLKKVIPTVLSSVLANRQIQ